MATQNILSDFQAAPYTAPGSTCAALALPLQPSPSIITLPLLAALTRRKIYGFGLGTAGGGELSNGNGNTYDSYCCFDLPITFSLGGQTVGTLPWHIGPRFAAPAPNNVTIYGQFSGASLLNVDSSGIVFPDDLVFIPGVAKPIPDGNGGQAPLLSPVALRPFCIDIEADQISIGFNTGIAVPLSEGVSGNMWNPTGLFVYLAVRSYLPAA